VDNQSSGEVNDDEERRSLGERLREARKYLGLKQGEVAEYLNIPRTALTDIENGNRRVEVIELTRLAKLYRQPIAHFTGKGAKTPFDKRRNQYPWRSSRCFRCFS